MLGEVSNPDTRPEADALPARNRLQWFERQNARVLEISYVQPDLRSGLGRDRDLLLLAFFDHDAPRSIPSADVRSFISEFYDATEGADGHDQAAAILSLIGPEVMVRAPR